MRLTIKQGGHHDGPQRTNHNRPTHQRERSVNKIAHADLESDRIDDVIGYIYESYDGAVDHVKNGDVLEVWGRTEEQEEQDDGEMDFRIHFDIIEFSEVPPRD